MKMFPLMFLLIAGLETAVNEASDLVEGRFDPRIVPQLHRTSTLQIFVLFMIEGKYKFTEKFKLLNFCFSSLYVFFSHLFSLYVYIFFLSPFLSLFISLFFSPPLSLFITLFFSPPLSLIALSFSFQDPLFLEFNNKFKFRDQRSNSSTKLGDL